jgi:CDP-glucose 4,6-dehydratase
MANKSDLEKMVTAEFLKKYFKGKKVFLTGHTGFKGSWMLQTLAYLGAEVKGYALAPELDSDLYHQIKGDDLCRSSVISDIREAENLRRALVLFEPDFVFHLAAQPLVLLSYENPLYTFETNGQGTANLLDALRFLKKKCVAVMITTDKVYENNDESKLFVEDDKLGGYDPYSASKAVSEIIISSYRSSFFNDKEIDIHQKSIASVRAGNVIGGGDFAANRIVPDIIKAISKSENVVLRNPHATRPWQHVIEPIGAYLLLATKMWDDMNSFNTAFNIGPVKDDVLSVEDLTKIAIRVAGKGSYSIADNPTKPHEASTLHLSIEKIEKQIGWKPKLSATQAIEKTVNWYLDQTNANEKCLQQIKEYFAI